MAKGTQTTQAARSIARSDCSHAPSGADQPADEPNGNPKPLLCPRGGPAPVSGDRCVSLATRRFACRSTPPSKRSQAIAHSPWRKAPAKESRRRARRCFRPPVSARSGRSLSDGQRSSGPYSPRDRFDAPFRQDRAIAWATIQSSAGAPGLPSLRATATSPKEWRDLEWPEDESDSPGDATSAHENLAFRAHTETAGDGAKMPVRQRTQGARWRRDQGQTQLLDAGP